MNIRDPIKLCLMIHWLTIYHMSNTVDAHFFLKEKHSFQSKKIKILFIEKLKNRGIIPIRKNTNKKKCFLCLQRLR